MQINPVINGQPGSGCCPAVHAKVFEIILIFGLLSTIVLLIIYICLTIWLFKYSTSILAIEIVVLILNVFCFIFSIILRILRSNESVFNNCYGGSMCMSIFSIILLIINFLCSIAEEVLCYYIITFVKMNGEDYIYFQCLEYYQELKNIFDLNVPRGFDSFRNLEEFYQYSNYIDYYNPYEYYDNDEPYYYGGLDIYSRFCDLDEFNDVDDIDIAIDKGKKVKKIWDYFFKIVNKLGDSIDDEISEEELNNKIKIMKVLPYVCINFNMFVQLLAFMLIIILIKRITIKSHYGYPQPQGIQTTNGLPSSFQNQIANNYINNNYINQMPPMNLQNTISGNSNADNNIIRPKKKKSIKKNIIISSQDSKKENMIGNKIHRRKSKKKSNKQ